VSFSFNFQFTPFDSSSQLLPVTYKKVSGCSDQGWEYEKVMCALFALKLSISNSVADFEIKANCAGYGNFDDVALKVTFDNGRSEIFLLQLKHSENASNVKETHLAAPKGDFSILKYSKSIQYLESIQEIEKTKHVSFILYTNSPTSISEGAHFFLLHKKQQDNKNKDRKNEDNKNEVKTNEDEKTEEVGSKLQKLARKKFLLSRGREEEGTTVFRFKLNQTSGSVDRLDDFLKRFYFFSHQTSAKGAQSLINAMLKNKYGINDATYSSHFIPFMKTWWSDKYILTKHDVVAKLVELTLTPFIQTISHTKCNEKSELLRDAIMKFDMTIVGNTNEEIIANIWNETASDEEISGTSKKYGLRRMGTENLSSEERSKVLWYLNKVPLIVKPEKSSETQVKHVIRLLEKIGKKKVVLLANATKEEFQGWKIFQNLYDLRNEGVYKNIVKDFVVSLQDRESISLDQLLNSDQKNSRSIETTDLIKMTQQKVTQIGRGQEKTVEAYISRSVSTISLDINKMSKFCKKTSSLLIICNVLEGWGKAIRQLDLNVKNLDEYVKLVETNNLSKVDVLLTSSNWSQVRFNDICKNTERNVHLLQVFGPECCTSVLSKENRFSLEIMKYKEACVHEMEIFTYLDHPLNVICSPPGMGKSTLVSGLNSICPPSYWSVRINLINHKTVFKKECEYHHILDDFVKKEEGALAIKIRSMLLQNKRIYFFLDGLDEIDSDCLQIALDFIKHISSLGHRVWITSRENLEQKVSQSLDIFPIKIEKLTEDQQKVHIQERLQNIYQEDVVQQITNKIYKNVDIVNSRDLLKVPLQLFMVTENFRVNKDLWKEPDQEIFVLTKMYKTFFQGKKRHQLSKMVVQEHENEIGYVFDLYLEQYELPALKSCLDATTFDKLKVNFGTSQKKFLGKLKTGDPFGIVSEVTNDDQAIFHHQTYAEYFACAWMKNNLDKVSLLQDDLFTKKNENLKVLFDIMLAEDNALHLAVIYRDTNSVKQHLDNSDVKDEGGRSPLHLLCSYGIEHSHLSSTEGTWWFLYPGKHISCKGFTKNYMEGVSTQYRKLFNMLSHCDVFQNDNVFQWNCLDYAFRLDNFFAVEHFLERFEDPTRFESLFKHHDTIRLAYYSSQMGYAKLLHAVIEKDSNVLSVKIGTCGLTLLHVAIMAIKKNNKYEQTLLGESIKVMTTLIKRGLDVNAQCDCKTTALHLASELNDDAIVKFLLKEKANINLTDYVGRNALHFALKNSKVNMGIIKLLIDKGIDAEARDVYGKTPLHLCCREGHYEALVMLLDHGLDVKVATKYKINLIHAIFRQSIPSKEMMNLLISRGADVKGKDCYGRTALHYACLIDFLRASIEYVEDVNARNNHKRSVLQHIILSDTSKAKIISFLLENGASVNAKDSANRSVLHYATFQRNYRCIRVLLDNGANVAAVCDSGKTVLHAAFEGTPSPDVEVIQLLLNHGVDPKVRDKNKKTALDYAVTSSRSRRVVNILFDARAHEQLISADCVTFLHYAVYHGNHFAVKLFLEGGLDLDKIDVNNREYPLNFAVENQHLRSDMLLKMTKFIRDCKKKSNFGRKRIVELLKEYFSKGYGSDRVSFFNNNLCLLYVFIFQKDTVIVE
jgi:ankyrin repeat protein